MTTPRARTRDLREVFERIDALLEGESDWIAAMATDVGSPRPELTGPLRGAHLLVLEFNYDPRMMREGPYPPILQRRITGTLLGMETIELVQHCQLLPLLAAI